MNLLEILLGRKFIKRGRMNYETLKLVEDKWPGINQALLSKNPSSLKQAVIEADKIVDYVLRQLYPETETMGERLKLAKEKFLNNKISYDDLWYAHKVRNELVHNTNFNLPSFEVQSIIDKFAKGLELLGAKR